jgi:hypothetical protein
MPLTSHSNDTTFHVCHIACRQLPEAGARSASGDELALQQLGGGLRVKGARVNQRVSAASASGRLCMCMRSTLYAGARLCMCMQCMWLPAVRPQSPVCCTVLNLCLTKHDHCRVPAAQHCHCNASQQQPTAKCVAVIASQLLLKLVSNSCLSCLQPFSHPMFGAGGG